MSPPLGIKYDATGGISQGGTFKMRKKDAEIGSYIGTNCPHVKMLTYTNNKRNILS